MSDVTGTEERRLGLCLGGGGITGAMYEVGTGRVRFLRS